MLHNRSVVLKALKRLHSVRSRDSQIGLHYYANREADVAFLSGLKTLYKFNGLYSYVRLRV